MGTDLYFYQQVETRKIPKRYRKIPEELPESLRFAHLNPKVAALLAKERSQRPDNEDPFGDGMGKKSLLPDINAAFTNVRNQFDNNLSNDEDSQRYLFEEAKMSAGTILQQLSRIIYFYEDLHSHIPKSLEYQLMSGWGDLTNDITIVPREWQTHEMKEQYTAKQQQEMNSDEDISDNDMLTGRSKSRMGTSERSLSEQGSKLNVKRSKPRLDGVDEGDLMKPDSRLGRRSESRASATGSVYKQHLDIGNISRVGSRRKGSITGMSPSFFKNRTKDDLFSIIAETPVDARSTALNNPLSYMQTINFQLSNKTFEDKGWIMLKGRQEEIDQNEILEYCVTRLQESMKQIATQRQKDSEQGTDKPVIVRYYGDTKKETLLKYRKSPVKSNPSPIFKGGKPRIPSIIDERNEGKKLMQASHQDGSCIIYYPSGRPAVIHSAAGFGRPGFYTIVYEDGLDSKMLACFTPNGRGVCYYDNGVVRFLATDKGGHMSDQDGKQSKKWKWPHTCVKITEPVSFQISNHVMFRCVSQGQMTLVFSCQKEMARFTVGPVPEADEYKFIDESDQLLSTFTFSSKAAKDLMRIFAPTKKSKRKQRKVHIRLLGNNKQTSKSQASDIIKLTENFPDRVSYDIEADKELAKLQRKAKNLVDDWLEHYRLAVGFTSPYLQNVQDTPNYSIANRHAKSARLSDHQQMIRKAILRIDDDQSPRRIRISSAPLDIQQDDDDDAKTAITDRIGTTVTFEDHDDDGAMSPTAMAVLNRLSANAGRRSARSKVSSARSGSPSRQQTGMDRAPSANSGSRSHCPLVIRQYKLGYERPQCRCSRHHIPFIMDLELDEFVATESPEGQLTVIMVVSSLFPGITKAEEMVNEIYTNQNRNRTRPCVQSRSDMFRVFKYDINSAAEMSDHTQPLLLTRHNVVPGMFLIYCDGKLLFCDHIFNGYGNTRKDFKKQIMKSRHDSIHGNCLPKDFKFSPSKGQSGMRSAWGGEIGGAGVDKYSSPGTVIDTSLQAIHRPESSSTNSGLTREIHVDAVKYRGLQLPV